MISSGPYFPFCHAGLYQQSTVLTLDAQTKTGAPLTQVASVHPSVLQGLPLTALHGAKEAVLLSPDGRKNNARYKTEMCRPYLETGGHCKYGEKCQFAHGFQELRQLARHPKYKTEKCRGYHETGYCPYGTRCHFVHDEEPERRPVLFPELMPMGPTLGSYPSSSLGSSPIPSSGSNSPVASFSPGLLDDSPFGFSDFDPADVSMREMECLLSRSASSRLPVFSQLSSRQSS